MFDGGLCVEGRDNAPAIDLVRRLLKEGLTVKVIAPRVLLQGEDDGHRGKRDPKGHIDQWCERRFNRTLTVTLEIDLGMTAIYGVCCHGVRVAK